MMFVISVGRTCCAFRQLEEQLKFCLEIFAVKFFHFLRANSGEGKHYFMEKLTKLFSGSHNHREATLLQGLATKTKEFSPMRSQDEAKQILRNFLVDIRL